MPGYVDLSQVGKQMSAAEKAAALTADERAMYTNDAQRVLTESRLERGVNPDSAVQLDAYRADYIAQMDAAGDKAGHDESAKEKEAREKAFENAPEQWRDDARIVSDLLYTASYQEETARAKDAEITAKVARDGPVSSMWKTQPSGRPTWTDGWITAHEGKAAGAALQSAAWSTFVDEINTDVDAAQKPPDPAATADPGATTDAAAQARQAALMRPEVAGSFSVIPEENLAQAKDFDQRIDVAQEALHAMVGEVGTLGLRIAGQTADKDGGGTSVNFAHATQYASAVLSVSMSCNVILKFMARLANVVEQQAVNYDKADGVSSDVFKALVEGRS